MPSSSRGLARARLVVGAAALSALLVAITTASATAAPTRHPGGSGHGPVVATDRGLVRGIATNAADEFLGIPYAAPPVGALRWQPPQSMSRWPGVRQATQYAPHCPQSASPFGIASSSEDCLYLNVFAPGDRGRQQRNLPVMVWIHGGALVTGESDDYDPTDLVRHGAIVVTINYRLGALGFLATSSLAAEQAGHAGNYGLMDQQAALRWVQRNIGRFGGDRHNVTIFGESAGGLSVLSQLASPQAHGLFGKAIVESGAYALTQAPLAQAEASGASFAAAVGCESQSISCLRQVPVSTILGNESTVGYQPDIDGRVLTQSLGTSFVSGQFNRVPVMNGTNHDEWRLFAGLDQLLGNPVTAENYQYQFGVPPDIAAKIVAQYPLSAYASPALAVGAVGTDATYACPALSADTMLSKYVPTYAYEFSDEQAPEVFLPAIAGFSYGAAHASELQYLFGLHSAYPAPLSSTQQQLAARMRAYWTNFAKRGFPSGSGAPLWPGFTSARQRVQSLVTPQPHAETGFAAEHQCAFWSSLSG
jgi:para-nitrobenzyl esterase